MNFKLMRDLVKTILQSPFDLKWSVQGLGMLRTYISDDQVYRLHIWDSALRVPGVSPIHDHPWHLHSTIVAGNLIQRRYSLYEDGLFCDLPLEMLRTSTIKPGENAFTKTDPENALVYAHPLESYLSGQEYSQRKDEIHESLAVDGTVTLVKRTFEGDRDSARVFWRGNGGWVDAAPRRATREEIVNATALALRGFCEASK